MTAEEVFRVGISGAVLMGMGTGKSCSMHAYSSKVFKKHI